MAVKIVLICIPKRLYSYPVSLLGADSKSEVFFGGMNLDFDI